MIPAAGALAIAFASFLLGIVLTLWVGWRIAPPDEIDELELDDAVTWGAGCTCQYPFGTVQLIANDCPVHGLDDEDRDVIMRHLEETDRLRRQEDGQ